MTPGNYYNSTENEKMNYRPVLNASAINDTLGKVLNGQNYHYSPRFTTYSYAEIW
jgi:hypothetical protein